MAPPKYTFKPAAGPNLAPSSAAQIANRIAGYTAAHPQPLTDPQITQRAQQTIDPLIASLTSRAQEQGKAAAGAIGGYANSVAAGLGRYADSAKNIYGGAEQSQAAADAALSGALKTGGNGLADALAGKLAQIGGNTGGLVDQTRQTGVGGGNALLATGSASLANLLAHGTAAQDEAAKMPGLALRQGQADIRDATLANNKSLADNVAGVTAQLPGIVTGLRSANDAKQTNIASAAEHLREFLVARNDALAAGQAKNDTTVAVADAKATAPSTAWTNTNKYVSDGSGNPIPDANGNLRPVPGYKVNKDGSGVVKIPPAPKPTSPKDTTKVQHSAVTNAESTLSNYFTKAATVATTDKYTGANQTVRIKAGSPTYNERIDRAVSMVHDILSPYMSDVEIRRYVTGKAAPFFGHTP